MFERMEISESIYEGVEEPSYRNPTQADANRAGHSRQKRGKSTSSWPCPEKGEIVSKRRK